MEFNHKDNILNIGTLVRVGELIGVIGGNDLDNCDLVDDCYISLNYYVVPLGSRFDEEYMVLYTELELIDLTAINPLVEIAKGMVNTAKILNHYSNTVYNFTEDAYPVAMYNDLLNFANITTIQDIAISLGCRVYLDGCNIMVKVNK